MAYIGKSPAVGNFVKLDAITVVNGQAAYTMQNSGVNFTDYSTVNQFLVSLNGIIQSPTSSFTVSGSTITFASNLVTNDVINFIIVFGNSLSAGTPTDATVSLAKLTATGTKDATTFLRGDNTFASATPADGSISTAKLADDAVTEAKIADDAISDEHLDPTVITGQTAETSVADDDLILLSDTSSSAALKKMTVANLVANAGGGKILQVVSVADTTGRSTTSSTFNTMSSALTLNITPSSTSSKILIMLSTNYYITTNDGALAIFRGSTNLGHSSYGHFYMHQNGAFGMATINYMDSPSTTSQVTYEIQGRKMSGGTLNIGAETGIGSLIAMEIGA